MTKVLEWARKNETLRIVDDQISSPTWARTLAEATAQVVAQGREEPVAYLREKRGLYHLAGGGACSRYEWAEAILATLLQEQSFKVKTIEPAKSDEFLTPAERPLKTFESVFNMTVPLWEEVLFTVMNQNT